MSREETEATGRSDLVALVQAQYERWNSKDLDAWVQAFHPEAEYHSSVAASADGSGVYLGHAGIRRFIAEYLDAWEYFSLYPDEYRQSGDQVVVLMRTRARGRTSGMELEGRLGHVWTFRDGELVRHQSFTDPAAALASAGLEK